MCDMIQFIASVALSPINSAELSRAFVEGILLKFGLCIVIVVDDNKKRMALFERTAKSLNI